MRYHAKERLQQGGGSEWFFEERETPLTPTSMLLVRVMIGKIEKKDRLLDIMRRTPIRQDQPGWNCVEWVKEVLEAFRSDGKTLGTSIIEWGKVRDAAMGYVQSKKDQHRFDGQGNFDMGKIPTYDLIEDKETTP